MLIWISHHKTWFDTFNPKRGATRATSSALASFWADFNNTVNKDQCELTNNGKRARAETKCD